MFEKWHNTAQRVAQRGATCQVTVLCTFLPEQGVYVGLQLESALSVYLFHQKP